jgi:hypothetical protein
MDTVRPASLPDPYGGRQDREVGDFGMPQGLGDRQGLELLVHLHREYFPGRAMAQRVAAATLGAWTDDPAGLETMAVELLGSAPRPDTLEATD